MQAQVNDNRILTSRVDFTDFYQNAEQQVYNLKFKKRVFADGQEIGVEEEVVVQIRANQILVQRSKPRTPGQRPEQGTPPSIHEVVNAYSGFTRSDADIESIMTDYVLPLYE